MKVIILAAGMGSRLKPLTNHMPKTMITVGNQTLIENIIQGLIDIQLSEIAIITGYQHEVLEIFLRRRFPTVRLQFIYNDQYSVKDNIYSFSLAEEYVGNEELLCICSDIYCKPKLLLRAVQAPFDILMVDDTKEIPSGAMKVRVNREGYITKISKELTVEEGKGEIVGISKISASNTAFIFKRVATYLDKGIVNVWWPYAINDVLEQIELRPWSTDGIGWVNVNTFDDLKEAINIAND
ncbi:sugar phosphate nucleotidyltransferase [Paenibacillus woosongensis]|uniref:NTP transferase domain-containing protein n=1 Tax=Paenibacillus woosongensis TaxID=307580 RepID=A0A7X2Z1F7_9BACL|nr:phosphocholine cytidylyltransferase family protein [Paenibacillus woosongensis]MUG45831.1 NTP transferase domain-containing protein [Paenibacillus woosongensis]